MDSLCEIRPYRVGQLSGNLFVFECVESTNTTLRSLAAADYPTGTVVIAKEQTAGRGRMGRRWLSPPGMGLYMSVLLRPDCAAADLGLITLMTAVAVTEAVRRLGVDARIKWPNDLIVAGRKLAGILTEAAFLGERVESVVVGVGVNLLAAPAGSAGVGLADSGVEADRDGLAWSVLGRLDEWLSTFLNGERGRVLDRWLELTVTGPGTLVEVDDGDSRFQAVVAGIESDGRLAVVRIDGERVLLSAADVSLYIAVGEGE